MRKQQAKNFLANNKEAFQILAEKLKEIDTVRPTAYTKYPEESRRLAIEIIEKWLTEIFGIANYEEIERTREDKDIFIRLKEDSVQVETEY